MTDRTHPDSGRIVTSGDVINDLHDTIDRREAVIKLLEQDSADAHAIKAEYEAGGISWASLGRKHQISKRSVGRIVKGESYV